MASVARSASRPRVVVVDPDPITRRMLRVGLEVDGALVIEAAGVLEAKERVSNQRCDRAVVDAFLADGTPGDVASLLTDGGVVVVLVTGSDDVVEMDGMRVAPKYDVAAIARALDLPTVRSRRLVVVDIIEAEADEIEEDWRELCRWDPMLPPDSQPPIAGAVIAALGEAVSRPQPLGWGADPEVEKVAEVYSRTVGSIDVAIGQLICLREVVRRRVATRIPPDEVAETDDRLHMVIDRAIAVAASRTAEQLEEQAFVDPLTNLLNRRALERDMRREVGRATRSERRFAVVLVDLDGLKRVNDTLGHAEGDDCLCRLAAAITGSLRRGDTAYRVGGDEFVVILSDLDDAPVDLVMARISSAGAPHYSWGAAVYPDDADDPASLLAVADRRLFEHKRSRKQGRGGDSGGSEEMRGA